MTYTAILERQARLIILQLLAAEANQSCMAIVLRETLADRWLITRSLEWVHEQMRFLAEMGALRVVTIGDTRIAELLDPGREHLARRVTIEGVKRAPDEAR